MVLQVYIDYISQPSRSLVMFLKNTTIPYEIVDVHLLKGEQKKPEFAAVNPLLRVPAIKDGDFCLAEVIAIFRYLVAKYPSHVPDHWYPADIEKRARVDEYLSYHHQGVRGTIDGVFMTEVLTPLITGKPACAEKIKEEEAVMQDALDTFERVFINGKPFILGDEICIADLMAVNEMVQNTVSGRHITEGKKGLEAYVNRVKARLNPIFEEVCDVIYKWGEEYRKKK